MISTTTEDIETETSLRRMHLSQRGHRMMFVAFECLLATLTAPMHIYVHERENGLCVCEQVSTWYEIQRKRETCEGRDEQREM